MADLLHNGLEWLSAQQKQFVGQGITYSRGLLAAALTATLGKTTYQVVDEYGFTVQAEVTDFVVDAVDLVLDEDLVMPQSGDRIEYNDETYEVAPLSGQGCYRRCDPYGQRVRIHTKRIY